LEDFFFGFTTFTALGAGVLLVASLSAGARTALAADPPLHTSPESAAEVAPLVEGFSSDPLDRLMVEGRWPFESVDAPSRVPGRARPDLLSAPGGWTYDAAGPSE
jgi:hypothetical protein